MRLNHLNLLTLDVPGTVELLGTYFGLRPVQDFPANEHMAFLHDEGGFLLSLFRGKEVVYPKMFHIGFVQETPGQVRALHEQITAGGLSPQPMREEHGRLTFYFDAPGGFVIEVEAFLHGVDE